MDKTVALWKWLLLFILAVVLGFVGLVALNIWTDSIENYVLIVLGAVALLALYWGGVRLIEKGPAKDLSLKRLVPHLGLGLLVGALFMGCVVGIIALCGCASFAAGDCTGREIAAACFLCLSTAVGEETLFRGILFRWLDERWGVVPALIVSGLLFGFLHLGNPNATVWSSIAIAIEAGLMLGAQPTNGRGHCGFPSVSTGLGITCRARYSALRFPARMSAVRSGKRPWRVRSSSQAALSAPKPRSSPSS